MTATMTSCSATVMGTKSKADLVFTAPRFSQALFQESFASKWWFSSEVEPWNFTKYKLLKLVNSMKMDFLFAGFNLNIIIRKKSTRKMHALWMH